MKKCFLLLGVCIMLGSCLLEDMEDVSNTLENGSQEDSSKEDDSHEDGSQEDGSKENGSEEDDSEEDGDEEDGSQEDDSQEESSQAAVFIGCKAVSENEIEFEFSRPVMTKTLSFEPALAVSSIEEGSTVTVLLEENAELGAFIIADLLVEDEDGNLIEVQSSINFRNSRTPELVINELCTENGTGSGNAGKRTEFVELKMKSYGNLEGIRILIIRDIKNNYTTIYNFQPTKVKNGDYVVLHLRTKEESCINEYNGNIEESGSINSSSLAWDFYVDDNTRLIHTTASAVYILDHDDNVLDAVMISSSSVSWAKDHFTGTAEFLFQQGAWQTADGELCGPADAVYSNGATSTRTICRDETAEDTDTAADWYICATSKATPGKPNSPDRFVR